MKHCEDMFLDCLMKVFLVWSPHQPEFQSTTHRESDPVHHRTAGMLKHIKHPEILIQILNLTNQVYVQLSVVYFDH